MMGRLNHDQEQLLYSFHLDEAVPHDHPVRKIAAVLDLSWIHSVLALFYLKMGYRNQDRIPTAAKLIFIRFAHDRRSQHLLLGGETAPRTLQRFCDSFSC
jgi:hypothetical protein